MANHPNRGRRPLNPIHDAFGLTPGRYKVFYAGHFVGELSPADGASKKFEAFFKSGEATSNSVASRNWAPDQVKAALLWWSGKKSDSMKFSFELA